MGARYLITGTQLGIIKALSTIKTPQAIEEIDRVFEHQYIFNSESSVYDDIRKIRDKINREEDDGK